jgi:hypothetical protein
MCVIRETDGMLDITTNFSFRSDLCKPKSPLVQECYNR